MNYKLQLAVEHLGLLVLLDHKSQKESPSWQESLALIDKQEDVGLLHNGNRVTTYGTQVIHLIIS